jgi:plastocyanin
MSPRRSVGAVVLLLAIGAWSSPPATTPAPGKVYEIRMIGDADGYRFAPARLSIEAGDSVAFVVASGQPHTVAFDTTAVAPPVARMLAMHMRDKLGTLSGPLLLAPGDRYVISFAGVPAGRYPYFCLPHLALRMMGEIVVR